jgi:hypothetical protein
VNLLPKIQRRMPTPTRVDLGMSVASWARVSRAAPTSGLRLSACDRNHMAAAGMPLGETTRRLWHGVETLVSTYAGALDDDRQVGNQRIDSILG